MGSPAALSWGMEAARRDLERHLLRGASLPDHPRARMAGRTGGDVWDSEGSTGASTSALDSGSDLPSTSEAGGLGGGGPSRRRSKTLHTAGTRRHIQLLRRRKRELEKEAQHLAGAPAEAREAVGAELAAVQSALAARLGRSFSLQRDQIHEDPMQIHEDPMQIHEAEEMLVEQALQRVQLDGAAAGEPAAGPGREAAVARARLEAAACCGPPSFLVGS